MLATLLSLVLNLTNCTQLAEQVNPDSATEVDNYASPRSSAIPDSNRTLKAAAPFPIGVATGAQLNAQNRKAADILTSQFNSKTVYAYMSTEPAEGTFNLGELNYWIRYAQSNPIRLHGHCLVYPRGAPAWLTDFKGPTSQFELAIKNHIQTLVGRYKGQIKSWDVLNEVTYYKSGAIAPTPFRLLYTSDKAYLNFIKRCFQWAHEADPDALLFYNDALYETIPSKLETVLKMVEDFKQSGIPIHGLGTQMHIDINTPNTGIRNSLLKLASTGLLIHISEFDVAINPEKASSLTLSNDLTEAQRLKYQAVAHLYKQTVPASQRYGITLWDLSDADSWLVVQKARNEAPCIFDADYRKKPAFYGLLSGLMN